MITTCSLIVSYIVLRYTGGKFSEMVVTAAGNTTDAGMGGEPGAMGGPDGGTGGGPGGGMGGGPGDGGGSMGGGLPGGNVPGIAPANTEVEPAATQYGVTGVCFWNSAPSYAVAFTLGRSVAFGVLVCCALRVQAPHEGSACR